MIIITSSRTKSEKVNDLVNWIRRKSLKTHITKGDYQNIIGVISDTSRIDEGQMKSFGIVEAVEQVLEPFKQANHKFHPHDTVVEVTPEVKIGHGNLGLIVGPCSVESGEQVVFIAQSVKATGATMPRGGMFRPRTSSYDFQGLKAEGLKSLFEVKKTTGLPIVTEITSAEYILLFKNVDVIQVGAWNIQNFEPLKELGRLNKLILLKRGLANTTKEFLMSAEYIMSSGNENVTFCERGIRTYEMTARNTLDLPAVPVLREFLHLLVVVDPSHTTSVARYVKPMAMTAVASGAGGLIVEVHDDLPHALSDGAQSLRPEQFVDVSRVISLIRKATIEADTRARRNNMEQVLAWASRAYEVIIDTGVLLKPGLRTAALIRRRRTVIVTDSNVGPLYGEQTAETLRQEDFSVEAFTFPAGEAPKNPEALLEVLTFLAKAEFTRQGVMIMFSGGVTGDLAGPAAPLYLRGTPCVQIPTSLLTMMDSSVGDRTAVGLPEGRNLVGTFTQPYFVLCDSRALDTPTPRVFAGGMTEVIKYGMTRSRELLELLLRDEVAGELEHIITQYVRLKHDVVAEDEQGFDGHQILNFDHTLDHVIEWEMNYKLFHGDCVAIGMVFMARVLMRDGHCPESCERILEKLLEGYQLPDSTGLSSGRTLVAARADKKRWGENITLIEPNIPGNCMFVKTDFTELTRLLEPGC